MQTSEKLEAGLITSAIKVKSHDAGAAAQFAHLEHPKQVFNACDRAQFMQPV